MWQKPSVVHAKNAQVLEKTDHSAGASNVLDWHLDSGYLICWRGPRGARGASAAKGIHRRSPSADRANRLVGSYHLVCGQPAYFTVNSRSDGRQAKDELPNTLSFSYITVSMV